jgi:hypothetical protein
MNLLPACDRDTPPCLFRVSLSVLITNDEMQREIEDWQTSHFQAILMFMQLPFKVLNWISIQDFSWTIN